MKIFFSLKSKLWYGSNKHVFKLCIVNVGHLSVCSLLVLFTGFYTQIKCKSIKGTLKVQLVCRFHDKWEHEGADCHTIWKYRTHGGGLFVGCLTSQQHASVSQGWICSDNFTCCHTETEVADQTFYLTQSQYTDTGPTCPSADPITPGTWQLSHWSANFWVTGVTRPQKNPGASGIRTQDLPLSMRTPYH